jgi:hypothetical protein
MATPAGQPPPGSGLLWHNGHVDEDVLSGHVFSALRYVADARHAFLSRLAQLKGLPEDALKDDRAVMFEPWPPWEVPTDHRRVFSGIRNERRTGSPRTRREEKGGIVPDLLLTAPGWRLVIEAEASKPYDAAQVVQQYTLDRLNGPREMPTFYVLVGPTIGRPRQLDDDIRRIWQQHEDALGALGIRLEHLLQQLLWIGWRDIQGLCRRMVPHVSEREALILLDVAELLTAQGYREIESPREALDACQGAVSDLRRLLGVFHHADSFPVEVLDRVFEARDSIQKTAELIASSAQDRRRR